MIIVKVKNNKQIKQYSNDENGGGREEEQD